MNYILGGGMAGLIAAHYNPSFKIISPDVGGQLVKHKNILTTFFVHDNAENESLLKELELKYSKKRIKIFYCYKGEVVNMLTPSMKTKFIKFKMSEFDYDTNSSQVKDTTLSTKDNYMDILDTDINLLIKKLSKGKTIINGTVKLINNNRKFILATVNGKLEILKYDKLISTMPANIFFFMLYNFVNNYSFNYLPATYVLSETKPDFIGEEGLYYIYDDNLIYNRVQKYSGGYIYEITGMPSDDVIKKQIPNVIDIERRYIGVIKSIEVDDFRNIKFVGRTAQWNHKVHLEESIIKSKQIKNNQATGDLDVKIKK